MRIIKLLSVFILLAFSLAFVSCDAINPVSGENEGDYSCEGCHTTKAMLKGIIDDLELEHHEEEEEAPG